MIYAIMAVWARAEFQSARLFVIGCMLSFPQSPPPAKAGIARLQPRFAPGVPAFDKAVYHHGHRAVVIDCGGVSRPDNNTTTTPYRPGM
jgi:hypothetical protein